jgi:hypothetical protein
MGHVFLGAPLFLERRTNVEAPWKLICLICALIFAAIGAFGGYAWRDPNAYPWRGGLLSTAFFFYILSLLVH